MAPKSFRRLSTAMSSLLRSLGDDSRDFSAALQPLDTDGAHPTPSPLTKDIQDLVQFINEGPAFTPKDLVSSSFWTCSRS